MRKLGLLLFFCLCYNVICGQDKIQLDSLQKVYKTTKHDTSKIMTLIAIAREYIISNPDTCIVISQEALQQSEKIGFDKGKSWALFRIGEANYNKRKETETLVYYQKALPIFDKIQDTQGLSAVSYNLGRIYSDRGNYPLAVEYYQKSLKISDKAKQARILNSIGVIYFYQKNYALSLEYFLKSLKMREELGNSDNIAGSLMNVGVIYYEQRKYTLSLEYLQKSLKVYEQAGDKQGIAGVLVGFGELYKKQGNYPLALKNLQKGQKITEGLENSVAKTILLYCYNNIADIYQKENNYDKGIEYAEKSLKLAYEINALVEIGIVSKTLFEVYKGKGDYVKALKYHELHKQTEDSLFNLEKTKAIANLEAKSEIEKQQAEIEKHQVEIEKQKEAHEFQKYINYLVIAILLSVLFFSFFIFRSKQKETQIRELVERQNEEIKQQKEEIYQTLQVTETQRAEIQQTKEEIEAQAEELERLNQFKNRLFSILAHDLRSPMATLRGTISILDPNILDKSELTTIKTELIKQFEVTDKILQDLLQWTKDQMKGETIEAKLLNLNEIVNEKLYLFLTIAQHKNITLVNELMPNTQVFVDENHVNIILQNLLSNALKFTYSGGTITVTSQKIDKMAKITVKDTGKGMDKEQQNKLFSSQYFTTKGTAGEQGNGLGLLLVKELVEKNGGKIWVTSEEGKGSAFCFLLPVAKQIMNET
jgi:signal transduction histidine kinase